MSKLLWHPRVPHCPVGTLVTPGYACPAVGDRREEEAERGGAGAAALVKVKQALEL